MSVRLKIASKYKNFPDHTPGSLIPAPILGINYLYTLNSPPMSFFRRISDQFQKQKESTASFTEEEKLLRRQQEHEALGKFCYQEDEFTYLFEGGPQEIKWKDILKIAVYKLDLMTTDELCLEMFWQDLRITFTEETPGWYQFLDRLEGAFPSIPKDWWGKVIHPAFATNYTVLYERDAPAAD